MADQEGKETPAEPVAATPEDAAIPSPDLDLAAALGGLDRATRDFSRRLEEAQELAARAAVAPQPAAHPREQQAPSAQQSLLEDLPERPLTREDHLREAEREARLYLERAKRRADSLVASMIGAVEEEAAAIRRDAEEGIRARWLEVENDAREHLEEAVKVGEGIVAERQQHLAALSEGITRRAEALSAGLEDAERIRDQFDGFIRALSQTADRISQQPQGSGRRVLAELHDLPRTSRQSAIAA
jgi:hypothetical protein